ncbi:DUF932 domain-containing protein [Amycolatopsis thailandensis]|uniref:DUF932 domain-containing protein n=1 Tax=Amycolatopsis thailandensis TaxID=589330 RepID=A0A229SBW0_9PSEU|nr:DUF932 domain-containing protein [Amycolatopsis thailandensis]OXM56423.1 DUF932 domain-containing protein [Amycolatopsis thailandensis]
MTTMESVLTRRDARLPDMVELLQRQHDSKLDVVVPARDLRMVGGRLAIDGIGEPTITLDGVTSTTGIFVPTATCDGGFADKLGIPVRYLRRMRETGHLDLLDHNINEWLAEDPAKRFLTRNFRGVGGTPGISRALLSEQYRFVDNLDVLMAVLEGIRMAGVHVDVSQCDLTETRMYVQIRCPEVFAYAPALLRNYTSPFTGNRGADNPIVFAGFVFSNSEVGHGSFSITPRIVVQVCDNGMTVTQDVMREVHLGGKLADGVVRWSADTQAAALDVLVKQARDAVNTFLNPAYVQAKIAEVEADAGVRVEDLEETITYVGKQLRFTEAERKTILSHFFDAGDRTSGGVLHAVTSAAQTIDDADEAYALERQGLPAMRHAAAFQR